MVYRHDGPARRPPPSSRDAALVQKAAAACEPAEKGYGRVHVAVRRRAHGYFWNHTYLFDDND